MRCKLQIFFGLAACLGSPLSASLISINQPGVYKVGGATGILSYAPMSPNDTIIDVSASNVVVDLDGRIIAQASGNFVSGLNGITVAPNNTNVTIRNGTIQNLTGIGISVGAGCSLIRIESIVTYSCDTRALSCTGLPNNQINIIDITDWRSFSGGQSLTADAVMSFSECAGLVINEAVLVGNGNSNIANFSALRLYNVSSKARLKNVRIARNQANGTLRGFDLTGVTNMQLLDCTVRDGTAGTNGARIDFDLQNSCSALCLLDCVAYTSATGSSNQTIGFRVQNGNSSVILENCMALNLNSISSTYGFYSLCNNVDFIDCTAKDCVVGTGNSTGFYLFQVSNNSLTNCMVKGYLSTASAYGFYYNGCSNCFTQKCVAANNQGLNDSQTFGFYITGGTSNAFIQNVASRNGTSNNTANQFYGLNTFNQTVVNITTSGPENVSSPWTNIGLL